MNVKSEQKEKFYSLDPKTALFILSAWVVVRYYFHFTYNPPSTVAVALNPDYSWLVAKTVAYT